MEAKFLEKTYRIIEDLPDVGYYILVFDVNGKNTHDFLQDSLEKAKEFCFEEFGIPIDSWTFVTH